MFCFCTEYFCIIVILKLDFSQKVREGILVECRMWSKFSSGCPSASDGLMFKEVPPSPICYAEEQKHWQEMRKNFLNLGKTPLGSPTLSITRKKN